jgi:hypothetical protein
MKYSYPLPAVAALVERIEVAPQGVPVRRVVVRDDNPQHDQGMFSLDDDPIVVALHWKRTARGEEQLVGLYRLHLHGLLEAGYVRRGRAGDAPTDIHLRFVHGERGVVYLQARSDAPALPVGMVDTSLG